MAKKKVLPSYESLDVLMKSLDKDFAGAIEPLEDRSKKVEFQTTNIIGLDLIMGGGRPKGRIIEVFGPESSGKSSLSYHMIGICQRLKGKAALIDAEYSWEPEYAAAHKIDPSSLILVHPNTGEEGLQIAERLIEHVDLIVVDSVAALVPEAEANGEVGASHIGLQARMMSQALRKLASKVSKSHCTIIFINQIRTKIGVMFGNPETTPGGNALKFYASIRLDVRRTEYINKEHPTGIKQRVKCIKNKVAPPFRSVELVMDFSKGYDVASDLAAHCLDFGVAKTKGPVTTVGDRKIAGGKGAFLKEIRKDSELRKMLKREVKKAYLNQIVGGDSDGDEGGSE